MNFHLVQFSVVVIGKVHNPSILNPDFLAMNEIVPEVWGWEVVETITTPPLAMIRYKAGVTVSVEHGKLQVADNEVGSDPSESRAGEIAHKYVETLPHVRYTAVGINYHSLVEIENPGEFLKTRFVRQGPWDSEEPRLSGVGLRLLYPIEAGQVVLSLDAGEAEKVCECRTEKKSVILANANFHRECGEYPAKTKVISYIKQAPSDWSTYNELIQKAFVA